MKRGLFQRPADLDKVDPQAEARLLTYVGNDFTGANEIEFYTAREAVAEAIAARNGGAFAVVRIWIDGHGVVDFPEIEQLHTRWRKKWRLFR